MLLLPCLTLLMGGLSLSHGQSLGTMLGKMSFSGIDACEEFASGQNPAHDGIVVSRNCGSCPSGQLCASSWNMGTSNFESTSTTYRCLPVPAACRKFMSGGGSGGGGGGGGAKPSSKPAPKPSPGPAPRGDICAPPSTPPSDFKRKPSGESCSRRAPYVFSKSRKTCTRLARTKAVYFCRRSTGPRLAAQGFYASRSICLRATNRKCGGRSSGGGGGASSGGKCKGRARECRQRLQTGRVRGPNGRPKVCNANGRRQRVYYFSRRSGSCRPVSFYGCARNGQPLTEAQLASAAYSNRFRSASACKKKCC